MDEHELEQVMRDGLQRRAEDADTTAPVVERARAARRRRRGRRAAVVLAAASVVAVVAAGAVLAGDDPEAGGSDRVAQPGPLPTEWRTEYWRDLKVDVPADWGYGGAPMDLGASDTLACSATAMVGADGTRLKRDDPTRGYVGRPIALTDVCQKYPFIGPDAAPPDAPYVWLGAAGVGLGTENLGDGWEQETVEVNGSRLTVATDDPALRERILASAGGGETCMSDVDVEAQSDAFPRYEVGNPNDVASMTVCAYQAEEGEDATAGRTAHLTYATTVDEDAAREYLRAMALGQPGRDLCPTANYDQFEWVVLELNDDGGGTIRRDVVHLACVAGVDVHASTLQGLALVRLTQDMARPWTVAGIPAVVYGPTGGKGAMIDGFIGPVG
jgi:hypothetical protein